MSFEQYVSDMDIARSINDILDFDYVFGRLQIDCNPSSWIRTLNFDDIEVPIVFSLDQFVNDLVTDVIDFCVCTEEPMELQPLELFFDYDTDSSVELEPWHPAKRDSLLKINDLIPMWSPSPLKSNASALQVFSTPPNPLDEYVSVQDYVDSDLEYESESENKDYEPECVEETKEEEVELPSLFRSDAEFFNLVDTDSEFDSDDDDYYRNLAFNGVDEGTFWSFDVELEGDGDDWYDPICETGCVYECIRPFFRGNINDVIHFNNGVVVPSMFHGLAEQCFDACDQNMSIVLLNQHGDTICETHPNRSEKIVLRETNDNHVKRLNQRCTVELEVTEEEANLTFEEAFDLELSDHFHEENGIFWAGKSKKTTSIPEEKETEEEELGLINMEDCPLTFNKMPIKTECRKIYVNHVKKSSWKLIVRDSKGKYAEFLTQNNIIKVVLAEKKKKVRVKKEKKEEVHHVTKVENETEEQRTYRHKVHRENHRRHRRNTKVNKPKVQPKRYHQIVFPVVDLEISPDHVVEIPEEPTWFDGIKQEVVEEKVEIKQFWSVSMIKQEDECEWKENRANDKCVLHAIKEYLSDMADPELTSKKYHTPIDILNLADMCSKKGKKVSICMFGANKEFIWQTHADRNQKVCLYENIIGHVSLVKSQFTQKHRTKTDPEDHPFTVLARLYKTEPECIAYADEDFFKTKGLVWAGEYDSDDMLDIEQSISLWEEQSQEIYSDHEMDLCVTLFGEADCEETCVSIQGNWNQYIEPNDSNGFCVSRALSRYLKCNGFPIYKTTFLELIDLADLCTKDGEVVSIALISCNGRRICQTHPERSMKIVLQVSGFHCNLVTGGYSIRGGRGKSVNEYIGEKFNMMAWETEYLGRLELIKENLWLGMQDEEDEWVKMAEDSLDQSLTFSPLPKQMTDSPILRLRGGAKKRLPRPARTDQMFAAAREAEERMKRKETQAEKTARIEAQVQARRLKKAEGEMARIAKRKEKEEGKVIESKARKERQEIRKREAALNRKIEELRKQELIELRPTPKKRPRTPRAKTPVRKRRKSSVEIEFPESDRPVVENEHPIIQKWKAGTIGNHKIDDVKKYIDNRFFKRKTFLKKKLKQLDWPQEAINKLFIKIEGTTPTALGRDFRDSEQRLGEMEEVERQISLTKATKKVNTQFRKRPLVRDRPRSRSPSPVAAPRKKVVDETARVVWNKLKVKSNNKELNAFIRKYIPLNRRDGVTTTQKKEVKLIGIAKFMRGKKDRAKEKNRAGIERRQHLQDEPTIDGRDPVPQRRPTTPSIRRLNAEQALKDDDVIAANKRDRINAANRLVADRQKREMNFMFRKDEEEKKDTEEPTPKGTEPIQDPALPSALPGITPGQRVPTRSQNPNTAVIEDPDAPTPKKPIPLQDPADAPRRRRLPKIAKEPVPPKEKKAKKINKRFEKIKRQMAKAAGKAEEKRIEDEPDVDELFNIPDKVDKPAPVIQADDLFADESDDEEELKEAEKEKEEVKKAEKAKADKEKQRESRAQLGDDADLFAAMDGEIPLGSGKGQKVNLDDFMDEFEAEEKEARLNDDFEPITGVNIDNIREQKRRDRRTFTKVQNETLKEKLKGRQPKEREEDKKVKTKRVKKYLGKLIERTTGDIDTEQMNRYLSSMFDVVKGRSSVAEIINPDRESTIKDQVKLGNKLSAKLEWIKNASEETVQNMATKSANKITKSVDLNNQIARRFRRIIKAFRNDAAEWVDEVKQREVAEEPTIDPRPAPSIEDIPEQMGPGELLDPPAKTDLEVRQDRVNKAKDDLRALVAQRTQVKTGEPKVIAKSGEVFIPERNVDLEAKIKRSKKILKGLLRGKPEANARLEHTPPRKQKRPLRDPVIAGKPKGAPTMPVDIARGSRKDRVQWKLTNDVPLTDAERLFFEHGKTVLPVRVERPELVQNIPERDDARTILLKKAKSGQIAWQTIQDAPTPKELNEFMDKWIPNDNDRVVSRFNEVHKVGKGATKTDKIKMIREFLKRVNIQSKGEKRAAAKVRAEEERAEPGGGSLSKWYQIYIDTLGIGRHRRPIGAFNKKQELREIVERELQMEPRVTKILGSKKEMREEWAEIVKDKEVGLVNQWIQNNIPTRKRTVWKTNNNGDLVEVAVSGNAPVADKVRLVENFLDIQEPTTDRVRGDVIQRKIRALRANPNSRKVEWYTVYLQMLEPKQKKIPPGDFELPELKRFVENMAARGEKDKRSLRALQPGRRKQMGNEKFDQIPELGEEKRKKVPDFEKTFQERNPMQFAEFELSPTRLGLNTPADALRKLKIAGKQVESPEKKEDKPSFKRPVKKGFRAQKEKMKSNVVFLPGPKSPKIPKHVFIKNWPAAIQENVRRLAEVRNESLEQAWEEVKNISFITQRSVTDLLQMKDPLNPPGLEAARKDRNKQQSLLAPEELVEPILSSRPFTPPPKRKPRQRRFEEPRVFSPLLDGRVFSPPKSPQGSIPLPGTPPSPKRKETQEQKKRRLEAKIRARQVAKANLSRPPRTPKRVPFSPGSQFSPQNSPQPQFPLTPTPKRFRSAAPPTGIVLSPEAKRRVQFTDVTPGEEIEEKEKSPLKAPKAPRAPRKAREFGALPPPDPSIIPEEHHKPRVPRTIARKFKVRAPPSPKSPEEVRAPEKSRAELKREQKRKFPFQKFVQSKKDKDAEQEKMFAELRSLPPGSTADEPRVRGNVSKPFEKRFKGLISEDRLEEMRNETRENKQGKQEIVKDSPFDVENELKQDEEVQGNEIQEKEFVPPQRQPIARLKELFATNRDGVIGLLNNGNMKQIKEKISQPTNKERLMTKYGMGMNELQNAIAQKANLTGIRRAELWQMDDPLSVSEPQESNELEELLSAFGASDASMGELMRSKATHQEAFNTGVIGKDEFRRMKQLLSRILRAKK